MFVMYLILRYIKVVDRWILNSRWARSPGQWLRRTDSAWGSLVNRIELDLSPHTLAPWQRVVMGKLLIKNYLRWRAILPPSQLEGETSAGVQQAKDLPDLSRYEWWWKKCNTTLNRAKAHFSKSALTLLAQMNDNENEVHI